MNIFFRPHITNYRFIQPVHITQSCDLCYWSSVLTPSANQNRTFYSIVVKEWYSNYICPCSDLWSWAICRALWGSGFGRRTSGLGCESESSLSHSERTVPLLNPPLRSENRKWKDRQVWHLHSTSQHRLQNALSKGQTCIHLFLQHVYNGCRGANIYGSVQSRQVVEH